MTDRLMQALNLLAEDSGAFDMVVWCPEQHALSFRRAGGWQWVNLWLHAGPEIDEHQAEANGGYGWGGTSPVVLWVDGVKQDNKRWLWNVPQRRIDGTQNPIDPEYAATHFRQLPPVPGLGAASD